MPFETSQPAFMAAISAVAPIVERRNTIPILGSVLIGDKSIRGTNLDIEVEASLGMAGRVKTPFAVDLSGLARLARHIPADETITVTEGKTATTLGFNGSLYRCIEFPGSDFPEFKGGEFLPEGNEATHNAGLIDAFAALRSEAADFSQDDASSPATFTSPDDPMTVVLMPMRA